MTGIPCFSHLPSNPTMTYTWDECFEIVRLKAPAPGADILHWKHHILKPHYHDLIRGEHDPRARRAFELLNFYYKGPPKPKVVVPPKAPPKSRFGQKLTQVDIPDATFQDFRTALYHEPLVRGDKGVAKFRFNVDGGAILDVRGVAAARVFRRVLRSNNHDFTMELL